MISVAACFQQCCPQAIRYTTGERKNGGEKISHFDTTRVFSVRPGDSQIPDE